MPGIPRLEEIPVVIPHCLGGWSRFEDPVYSSIHMFCTIVRRIIILSYSTCIIAARYTQDNQNTFHLRITCSARTYKMAYLSPSLLEYCDKETASFNTYDDLFEYFVDSDSYGLSDNTTDRSTSDEWEKYFDLPESLSGSDAISKLTIS